MDLHPDEILLLLAASRGNLGTVQDLIRRGVNVNATDENRKTALIIASEKGYLDIVKELIKGGANVDAVNVSRWTALMYAADKGHLDIVKELLNRGAKVNDTSMDGSTALMYAARGGHLDVVKELIKSGANIDAANVNGTTALIRAANNGNLAVVKELISHGADPTLVNVSGLTALDFAKGRGHGNVVNFLENLPKEDPDAIKAGGISNLMTAANAGQVFKLKDYLTRATNLDRQDDFGNTALIYSLSDNRPEIVYMLLQAGADPTIANKKGETALTYATLLGYPEISEMLVGAGADLDAGGPSSPRKVGKLDLIVWLDSIPKIDINQSCSETTDPIFGFDLIPKGTIVIKWVPGQDKGLCYDIRELRQYLKGQGKGMWRWVSFRSDGTMDDTGRGGKPQGGLGNQFYQIPPNFYIDENSYKKLLEVSPTLPQERYYEARAKETNVRIGNPEGIFGVSNLHGQFPGITIYQLIPRPTVTPLPVTPLPATQPLGILPIGSTKGQRWY